MINEIYHIYGARQSNQLLFIIQNAIIVQFGASKTILTSVGRTAP